MHKTVVGISAFALVAFGAAGCVSKSEYNKSVQAAQTRYDTLDAENARVKRELERTMTSKSNELGKNISDLNQRVNTLEGDKNRLTQELADAQKAREEKLREVSSTY